MPWTTPETFTAGQTLTAASMNVISDNLSALAPSGTGAWATFTPQLRQGTTNVNSTVVYARHTRVGNTVYVQALVTSSGTGSAGTVINLSHPSGLTPLNTGSDSVIGVMMLKDSGTAFYIGGAYANTGYIYGTSSGSAQSMGAAGPNFTLASGDTLAYSIMYEVA